MKVFHEEPHNRSGAESVCEAFGGHLASIGSQAENDAVEALLRSASASIGVAWIGLTDKAEEGTFVWSDGAPLLNFDKWGTGFGGQPNNDPIDQCGSYNSEDCVVAVPGYGWYDDPCEVVGAEWLTQHMFAVPNEPPDQHGCYPFKLPFVCSTPALSGTTV